LELYISISFVCIRLLINTNTEVSLTSRSCQVLEWYIAVTFEDKRRENFEKGFAELERRRAMLLEQQKREAEERVAFEKTEEEKQERARLYVTVNLFTVLQKKIELLCFLLFCVLPFLVSSPK